MSGREPIGLLVVTVRKRIKQVTSALLREEGLSPQQFWTMVVIARNNDLSLRELAARRRMDEPTACRVVNTLVRRRLVRRSPDPADRRRSRLMLTPSGGEKAARLLPLAETILAAVEGSLTPAERYAVVSGLRKVIANLDQFEKSQAGRGSPTAEVVP
ncbi:MAG: MarR family winged helix-turn-helix transcriptional regulator [Acidobacteriia bacterium]|nr:MarR family winged helix-turn-helix transcriptional regulator [Terriglobia bacterium]